jgi:hypothetical protein
MRLEVSAPTRSRVPTAAILVVALTTGTLLVGCMRAQRPPVPGAFVPPATPTALRLDVQQVRDGMLTVTGEDGTRDVAPPAGVPVYVLRSATPAEVRPGDWVVVAGVPNEVLNFTIRRITVIPAALGAQPDADGVPRLTGGLAGYEVGRDPHERPVLSGRVTAVVGPRISVAVGGRTATLEVTDAALLRRVVPGTVADIGAGDRIAAIPPRPGAPLEEATALLVLPATR